MPNTNLTQGRTDADYEMGGALSLVGLMLGGCNSGGVDDNSATEALVIQESNQTKSSAVTIATIFKKHSDLMDETTQKSILVVDKYIDLPREGNSTNSRGATLRVSPDMIEELLPHDISSLTRYRTTLSRSGDTTEEVVTLQEELDKIAEEYSRSVADLAVDMTDALKLEFVKKVDGGIMVDDEFINPQTIQGAVTIELLNAQARGEDIKKVTAEVQIALNEYYKETGLQEEYSGNNAGARAVAAKSTAKWDNGYIYYYWGTIDYRHRAALKIAMRDWRDKTGTKVDFRYYPSQSSWAKYRINTGELGVVEFKTAALEDDTGGSAPVGRTVRFSGALSISKGLAGEWLHRTTRHELDHVVGLEHEHERWDRNKYIEESGGKLDRWKKSYSWQRVWKSKFWGGYWTWKVSFKSYVTKTEQYDYTDYDCNSVMHYTNRPIIVDCGTYKIGERTTVAGNKEITAKDVKLVKYMYRDSKREWYNDLPVSPVIPVNPISPGYPFPAASRSLVN